MSRGQILLVEDEVILHMLWEDVCEMCDIRILSTATTCKEALAALYTQSDQLSGVILDVGLFNETTECVAEHLRTLSLPVVLSTGHEILGLPKVYHGWDALKKPYRQDEMVSALDKMVFQIC